MNHPPLKGSCQCEAIQFELHTPPMTFYCCHCTDCQKQSSSAFGLSVWVSQQEFKLTKGKLAIFQTKGESGNRKTCTYCADCGSRIYHAFDDAAYLSVKGGAISEISKFSPIAHIWVRSALPWSIPEDTKLATFEKDAEEEQLLALWGQSGQI